MRLGFVRFTPGQNPPFFFWFGHRVKFFGWWAWNLINTWSEYSFLSILRLCHSFWPERFEFDCLMPCPNPFFFSQFWHCVKLFDWWAWNLFDCYLIRNLHSFLYWHCVLDQLAANLFDSNLGRMLRLFSIFRTFELYVCLSLEFVSLIAGQHSPFYFWFKSGVKVFEWWAWI